MIMLGLGTNSVARKSLPLSFSAQPSLLHRLWRNAWADVWGFITVVAGTAGTGISYIGTVVSDPSVKSTLEEMNLPAIVMLVIGVITVIAVEHPPKSN